MTEQVEVAGGEARPERLATVAGLVVAVVAVLVCWWMPVPVHHFGGVSSFDPPYRRALLRLNVLLSAGLIAGYLLAPAGARVLARLRAVWQPRWTAAVMALLCVLQAVFVVHAGRRQFGAWDFNIVIDSAWRQVQGQVPYTDFIATTPEGFHLGAKWAFQLLGVHWDSLLYLTAAFTVVTFVWLVWLGRRLEMGSAGAIAMALAIECAANLTLCFWWYNNTVLVIAAVFYLTCLAYAEAERTLSVELSYVASLAVLALMKPNIAGVAILYCVPLLLLVARHRIRLLGWTVLALMLSVAVVAANHVELGRMLTSYLSVASERGALVGRYGFKLMTPFEQRSALWWVGIVSVPLLAVLPRVRRQMDAGDWRGLGQSAFVPVAFAVALYGLGTNGEFRDLECTVLLAAGGVLAFGRGSGPVMRRLYVAILCASIVGDLYYGAARLRVYTIGPERFFDWKEADHRIDAGLLRNMQVSGLLVDVDREVSQVVRESKGPVFFGPRLEFEYAAQGLESPKHFPTYWQPGTALSRVLETRTRDDWDAQRFPTLIFLEEDVEGKRREGLYAYYDATFRDLIAEKYVREEHGPMVTVYHRRPGM